VQSIGSRERLAFVQSRSATHGHRAYRLRSGRFTPKWVGAAGIQLVAIHDSWFLPEFLPLDFETWRYVGDVEDTRSGAAALLYVIEGAGQEWLKGLRDVYDWFVTALTGSPYENLATSASERWRQRVFERHWPKFTAS